jgi:hypothetical protein
VKGREIASCIPGDVRAKKFHIFERINFLLASWSWNENTRHNNPNKFPASAEQFYENEPV